MPKLLRARPPLNSEEVRQVRKLAGSRHAPGDWIRRARMIARSWDGLRTTAIARELQCHPQTVRERIARFNAEGLDGLGDRPGPGRKPRLTEAERSVLVGLVATEPPGRLITPADGPLVAADLEREAHWTLDALTAAARERGIRVGRSQVRRILLAGGGTLAAPTGLGHEHRSGVRPKRTAIVALYTAAPAGEHRLLRR